MVKALDPRTRCLLGRREKERKREKREIDRENEENRERDKKECEYTES